MASQKTLSEPCHAHSSGCKTVDASSQIVSADIVTGPFENSGIIGRHQVQSMQSGRLLCTSAHDFFVGDPFALM